VTVFFRGFVCLSSSSKGRRSMLVESLPSSSFLNSQPFFPFMWTPRFFPFFLLERTSCFSLVNRVFFYGSCASGPVLSCVFLFAVGFLFFFLGLFLLFSVVFCFFDSDSPTPPPSKQP